MGRALKPEPAIPLGTAHGVKAKPTTVTKLSVEKSSASSTEADKPIRQTPYQRLRERLAGTTMKTNTRRVTSVEDLQAILQNPNTLTEQLIIQMKLLWVSGHTYKDVKLVRLHFIDAASPEPLEELLALFRDTYDTNRDEIDETLLTATLWNTEPGSPEIPPPGEIVEITAYTGLKLFRKTCCQISVKLRDLVWGSNTP